MAGDYVNEKIGANYMRGKEAVGGWINFDEKGLTFKSHPINIQTGETRIEYADIREVKKRKSWGIVPNGISVYTNDNFEHKFVIHNREQVIEFLKSKIIQ